MVQTFIAILVALFVGFLGFAFLGPLDDYGAASGVATGLCAFIALKILKLI